MWARSIWRNDAVVDLVVDFHRANPQSISSDSFREAERRESGRRDIVGDVLF